MKFTYYALRVAKQREKSSWFIEQEKEVKLVYFPSEFQLASIVTKALPKGRFEFLRIKLGLMAKSLKEECSRMRLFTLCNT